MLFSSNMQTKIKRGGILACVLHGICVCLYINQSICGIWRPYLGIFVVCLCLNGCICAWYLGVFVYKPVHYWAFGASG